MARVQLRMVLRELVGVPRRVVEAAWRDAGAQVEFRGADFKDPARTSQEAVKRKERYAREAAERKRQRWLRLRGLTGDGETTPH